MSQQQGQNDSTEYYLLMGIIVFFGLYFYIQNNYSYLAFVWKYIKMIELSFFYAIPDWVPVYGDLYVREIWNYLWDTPYHLIASDTIIKINSDLNGWVTWPLGMLVLHKGLKRSLVGEKIDTIYDHNTLLEEMSHVYPALKPYIEAKIEYQSTRYDRELKETYQYGCSLDPSDFAEMNPPLGLEKEAKKNKNFNNSIWDGDDAFDEDLATRAFEAQIGNRYSGIESLNEVEKGCYDIMVSKMENNFSENIPKFREYIYSILKIRNAKRVNISRLSPPNKSIYKKLEDMIAEEEAKAAKKKKKFNKKAFVDKRNILSIIKDPRFKDDMKNADAQDILSKHAFIRSGLMSLFFRARSVGVIDTSPFSWVKEKDRVLWFCISSFGRKVSYVECGGPFAHRLVEESIGEPLHTAEVAEAVQALKEELKMAEREKIAQGKF